MSRKIYLASSWRNTYQQGILQELRTAGHEVYDFRNPTDAEGPFSGDTPVPGFHWSDIDPNWKDWSTSDFRKGLTHPKAQAGFALDMKGLQWADTVVMLLPCGKSAHLEAGWLCGFRDAVNGVLEELLHDGGPVLVAKPSYKAYALIPTKGIEPELMYGMFDGVAGSTKELLAFLSN